MYEDSGRQYFNMVERDRLWAQDDRHHSRNVENVGVQHFKMGLMNLFVLRQQGLWGNVLS